MYPSKSLVTGFLFASLVVSSNSTADVSVTNNGAGSAIGTILIHSEIKRGDFEKFVAAADAIRTLTRNIINGVPFIHVEFDTPGGDVMEAVKIGRVVHERFMITRVLVRKKCVSACAFILAAGAVRIPLEGSIVGLHRPRFDADYFANLTPPQARAKYNALIEELRQYWREIGGSDKAFNLMLSTPSDRVRFLTFGEMVDLDLNGQDPSWRELSNAKMVQQYGKRWPWISRCAGVSGDFNGCVKRAYEFFPD